MDAMNSKIVTALEDARWMDSLCEFTRKMLKEEWISEEKRKFLVNALAENEQKTRELKQKVIDLLYEKNAMGYFDPAKVKKKFDDSVIFNYDKFEMYPPDSDEDELALKKKRSRVEDDDIFNIK